jgi:Family of unknown function (DUF6502)
MIHAVQSRMLRAVYATLRPLARLLIRSGVTYGQFAEISKLAFVQEANREKDQFGRPVNASRVAVKTGISRKEVRRIRQLRQHVDRRDMRVDGSAVPAQLLHLWYTDPKYLDSNDEPRPLPMMEPSPSFAELVRSVSGDVPLGAVRAELRQAGAIEESSDGRVRALKQYYVPSDFDEKALTAIVGSLFTLSATTEHNADPERASEGFIQRFAYSSALRPEAIAQFRRWSRVQATDFLETVDRWLGTHESSTTGQAERPAAPVVGIGVYYYEGPSAEDLIGDDPLP